MALKTELTARCDGPNLPDSQSPYVSMMIYRTENGCDALGNPLPVEKFPLSHSMYRHIAPPLPSQDINKHRSVEEMWGEGREEGQQEEDRQAARQCETDREGEHFIRACSLSLHALPLGLHCSHKYRLDASEQG